MPQNDMITMLIDDIADQPAALARMIEAYRQGSGSDALTEVADLIGGSAYPAMFLGMGGSHAACVAAAQSLNMAGTPAIAADAAEFLHYQSDGVPEGVPLIMVSYSGISAEPIEIKRNLHDRHPLVLLTDKPATPLAKSVDHVLPLHCGPELSVATKSYTNTLALLILLGAKLRGVDGVDMIDRAPDRCARLIDDKEMGPAILSFFDGMPGYLDVIGRGPGYGTALHAGLILREFLALRGGWMTGGAFRHGPLLDVTDGDRAIVIAGGRTAGLGHRLARDFATRGGRAIFISNEPSERAEGVMSIAIEAENEALFALLASLPVENFLRTAAERFGTAYVRIQTEHE